MCMRAIFLYGRVMRKDLKKRLFLRWSRLYINIVLESAAKGMLFLLNLLLLLLQLQLQLNSVVIS